MKVFLSVPPALKSGSQIPDLGLGYLAAAMRRHGHSVSILQAEKDEGFEPFRAKLLSIDPDLVGLKVYSLEINAVRQAIEIIRTFKPHVPIVLGGPHISVASPEEIMTFFDRADFAIRGEGEIPFPQLGEALAAGKRDLSHIPGLVWRSNGKIISQSPVFHDPIDDFGFPAWDLIDPRRYTDRWYFWSPEHPGAPFLTSRGCPYRCTFCAQNVVSGKRVRRRGLDSVIAELALLQQEYGVYDFDFTDDNFLMDPIYVRRFCEEVLARGWLIRWNCCGARLDYLDLDLLKLMDRAGCTVISVGFESGSQRVLDYMKKDLDLQMAIHKANQIARHTDIRIMGLFILGYPNERDDEIRKTIRYSLRLPLFIASYNTYIIMPGCEEYQRLLATGQIEKVPWDKIGLDEHVYTPPGTSMKRLKLYYKLAYWSFFARPLTLWRILVYSWRRFPRFVNKAFRKFLWIKR